MLTIEVGNPADTATLEPVEFLIDSGAIYFVAPRPVLEKLGIKPHSKQEFRLANGQKIERDPGMAFFRYGDRVGGADVVFGEPDDSALLGAFSLEAMGYGLDPLKRELIALPMILGGYR
ncbi:MAG: aspartyl protease family protein [Planctomycetota bacterium]